METDYQIFPYYMFLLYLYVKTYFYKPELFCNNLIDYHQIFVQFYRRLHIFSLILS